MYPYLCLAFNLRRGSPRFGPGIVTQVFNHRCLISLPFRECVRIYSWDRVVPSAGLQGNGPLSGFGSAEVFMCVIVGPQSWCSPPLELNYLPLVVEGVLPAPAPTSFPPAPVVSVKSAGFT